MAGNLAQFVGWSRARVGFPTDAFRLSCEGCPMSGGVADLAAGDVFTLLGVRTDGVASIVDLVDDGLDDARRQAQTMLREHASCVTVELWRDGALLEQVRRT